VRTGRVAMVRGEAPGEVDSDGKTSMGMDARKPDEGGS
jgi:hypothetical protein